MHTVELYTGETLYVFASTSHHRNSLNAHFVFDCVTSRSLAHSCAGSTLSHVSVFSCCSGAAKTTQACFAGVVVLDRTALLLLFAQKRPSSRLFIASFSFCARLSSSGSKPSTLSPFDSLEVSSSERQPNPQELMMESPLVLPHPPGGVLAQIPAPILL